MSFHGVRLPPAILTAAPFRGVHSTQQQILKTVELIKSFHAYPLRLPVTVPARPARSCRSNKLWSCLIGLCVRLEHVDSASPLGVRHYKPPASLLPVSPGLSRHMPSVLGTLTGRVYIGVHRIRLLLVALPRACVRLWWPVLTSSGLPVFKGLPSVTDPSSGFTRLRPFPEAISRISLRIHHNQKERPFYTIHARLDWVSVLMPVAECFFSRPRSLIVAPSFRLSAPKLRVTLPLLDYAQVAQRPSTSGCHCRRECWHLTVFTVERLAVFPCGHSLLHRRNNSPGANPPEH